MEQQNLKMYNDLISNHCDEIEKSIKSLSEIFNKIKSAIPTNEIEPETINLIQESVSSITILSKSGKNIADYILNTTF